MKTVIIDDEPLAVRLLEQYVARHPELDLRRSFTNSIDGLAAIQADPPGLLLLDIQMPDLSGLHLARLLDGRCPVIFTTAYEHHALAGFELDAVDYLLKPIAYARFSRAVSKLAERRMRSADLPDTLFVRSGARNVRVSPSTIQYARSAGDYLLIYLTDGSRVMTLENLSDLLGRLPASDFCRIHRGHFVRLDQIDYVERGRVVIGSVRLAIGGTYSETFRACLDR